MKLPHKIGFCCKYVTKSNDNIVSVEELNYKTISLQWSKYKDRQVIESRLVELLKHNIDATYKLLNLIGTLDDNRRMVRLGSDIFPRYTHPDMQFFWNTKNFLSLVEDIFAEMGDYTRNHGIRLSMHPGQYNVISSDKDSVVLNTLKDLEYHALIAKLLGFGKNKLDFKINVHLSGKNGIEGFHKAYSKMSNELRNCLTLENDEYQTSLDDLLPLKSKVGIVLDLHHHFIHSGEYIMPDDSRINDIIESWNGITPTIHYSQSRPEYVGEYHDSMPSLNQLLSISSKSKLRAHSNYYHNTALNKWALEHLSWADMAAECKAKNLAVDELVKFLD